MDLQLFYNKTYAYLVDRANEHNIDSAALSTYFTPQTGNGDFFKLRPEKNLNNLLFRFAFHAQNGGQISKVIKFPTTNSTADMVRSQLFAQIFYNFDPMAVLKNYQTTDDLFEIFIQELNLPRVSANSITQDYKRSMPYKYCKSVLSAAAFLAQFENYESVIAKLKSLGDMAPIYLTYELYGFDIALACDFMKELEEEFNDFPKPDTHIMKLLFALGLIDKDAGPEAAYKSIRKMKDLAKDFQQFDSTMTAYKLDKIFWLICSETFYNHDNIRNSGDTKRKKFVTYIQAELGL